MAYRVNHMLALIYMYKKNQLESTFIEIIDFKKSNIVLGCIYKNRSMDVSDFDNYLVQLLGIVTK